MLALVTMERASRYVGCFGFDMGAKKGLCSQGRAAVLDVGPSSVLHTRLIMDGLQVIRHESCIQIVAIRMTW